MEHPTRRLFTNHDSTKMVMVTLAAQAVSATAAPVRQSTNNKTHYGDPKAGCLTDEQNITLQGPGNRWVVAGDFCSAACQLPDPSKPVYKCPSDIPTGVTAKPQCAQIVERQLPPFCALVCQYPIPHGLYECGANATCKRSSPPWQAGHAEGVCTYDD